MVMAVRVVMGVVLVAGIVLRVLFNLNERKQCFSEQRNTVVAHYVSELVVKFPHALRDDLSSAVPQFGDTQLSLELGEVSGLDEARDRLEALERRRSLVDEVSQGNLFEVEPAENVRAVLRERGQARASNGATNDDTEGAASFS